MQFFLANLYADRLSAAPVPATQQATPSVATVVVDDDPRLAEDALVGSR